MTYILGQMLCHTESLCQSLMFIHQIVFKIYKCKITGPWNIDHCDLRLFWDQRLGHTGSLLQNMTFIHKKFLRYMAKSLDHLWLLSIHYHPVTMCYQRYIKKLNNASFMAVVKTLPCSYQVLPKIYKETKYCLFMAVIKTLPCSYQVLPKIYKETK